MTEISWGWFLDEVVIGKKNCLKLSRKQFRDFLVVVGVDCLRFFRSWDGRRWESGLDLTSKRLEFLGIDIEVVQ